MQGTATDHNLPDARKEVDKLRERLKEESLTQPQKEEVERDLKRLGDHIHLVQTAKIFADKGKIMSSKDEEYTENVKLLLENKLAFHSNNQILMVARNMKFVGNRIQKSLLSEEDWEADLRIVLNMCIPWAPEGTAKEGFNPELNLTLLSAIALRGGPAALAAPFEENFFYYILKPIIEGCGHLLTERFKDALEAVANCLVDSPPDLIEELDDPRQVALECTRASIHVIEATDVQYKAEFGTIVQKGALKKSDTMKKEGKSENAPKQFNGLYYETQQVLRSAEGTKYLYTEAVELEQVHYKTLAEVNSAKELIEEAVDTAKKHKEMVKVLDTWRTWKKSLRTGCLTFILEPLIKVYCEEYIEVVNKECATVDNITVDNVHPFQKTLDDHIAFLEALMLTGCHSVFAQAEQAKQAITGLQPKLKLIADNATIGPTFKKFTGSEIVSHKGKEALTKLNSVMKGCSTDVLRDQNTEAIRILNEVWIAVIAQLGVSDVDNGINFMVALKACLYNEKPNSQEEWGDSIEVLRCAESAHKLFAKYLAFPEPRPAQDPGATHLKDVKSAHTDLLEKCKKAMKDLDFKDIETFANKMNSVVEADAKTHIENLKTIITNLFDGGYNGPGSLRYVDIVGGKEDGGHWSESLKERAQAKTVIQLARTSGLLKRSKIAFASHITIIRSNLLEARTLAKTFGVTIDDEWDKKYSAMEKQGQITHLESRIITLVIENYKKPQEMAKEVKLAFSNTPAQIRIHMHKAMTALFNAAKGSRNFDDLGDLTIDGKDEDPEAAAPQVEGNDEDAAV